MEGGCAMPTVNVDICPEISKKNHLFRIIVLFMMLLFAVCAADVFFCGNHDRNELSDQSFMIETMTASGSAAADGDNGGYQDVHRGLFAHQLPQLGGCNSHYEHG